MPWKEKDVMLKKLDFIKDYEADLYSIAELSRRHSISRTTAYKYIKRYEKYGKTGLEELSRAPKHVHNTTSEEIIQEIVETKLVFPLWGSKKIIAKLSRDNPDKDYPCSSTAQHWLDVYGMVKKRKKRYKVPPYTKPFAKSVSSNKSWSMDYKGQFKLGNGQYCYPLTLVDNYSRFLFLCVGLPSTNYADARKWLEWAFREYGLPDTIRSDNGSPFAAAGPTGLTKLAAWFIQLGITHERIDLGHPEQNGRLERLHRTLKDHIKGSVKATMSDMQTSLNKFRDEYNRVRPHESLGFNTPSETHKNSLRKYPVRISPPEYDLDLLVRKVQRYGHISHDWKEYMISRSLQGEYVGLKLMEGGKAKVFYYKQCIATIDLKKGSIHGKERRVQYQESIMDRNVSRPRHG